MRREKKRLSVGSVLALLFAFAVLCVTVALLSVIRNTSVTPQMDAERLVGYLGRLAAAVQPTASDAVAGQIAEPRAVMETPKATDMQQHTSLPAVTVTVAPQIRRASLTIGGNIAFSDKIIYGTHERSDGQKHPENVFLGISDALHADVNIAMLDLDDLTVSTEGTLCAQALRSAGISCALIHGRTKRENDINDLEQALLSSGITSVVGGNEALLKKVNGIPLTVLMYAENQGEALAVYSAQQAQADISRARDQGAAAVIVFVKWTGNAEEPTAEQRQIAQQLCNSGADMLLGLRPNMVFSVEYLYSDDDAAHCMLTAWSLGTLLSEFRGSRAAVSAALLHVELKYDEAANRIQFENVRYTPVYAWGQNEDGRYRYRLLQSALPAPEAMNGDQKEIMGRSLKLIQNVMGNGVAIQQ